MKEGYQISCLSKDMGNKIRQHQNNGYILQKAEIENIVIWNVKNGISEWIYKLFFALVMAT
jgi:hypothetical protein